MTDFDLQLINNLLRPGDSEKDGSFVILGLASFNTNRIYAGSASVSHPLPPTGTLKITTALGRGQRQ